MGKRKIKGLNQTIKRWKFLLESSFDNEIRAVEAPRCGFCKYYFNRYRSPYCSAECPVVKYRRNTCDKDKDYSDYNKAISKPFSHGGEIPYVMSILVWLFQLKHGVFDE